MRSALRELLSLMSSSYAHPGVFLARTNCVDRPRAHAPRSPRNGLIMDVRATAAQESVREGRPTPARSSPLAGLVT
jgi:hypothetical protein